MLAVVMQEGWNGLQLGKALKDKAAAGSHRTLPLGMASDQGDRSGHQHHIGGRRIA